MIDPKEVDSITRELNECETAQQMFSVLFNRFDLENCKIGFVVKPLFIKGIITAIKLINPKKHEYKN